MARALRLRSQAEADALQARLRGKVVGPAPAPASAAPAAPRPAAVNFSAMLADQLRLAKRPAPVLEYRFAPPRKWRFDLAYPDRRLAVEVDGAVHRIRERFKADMEKHQAWFFLGWCVLRVSPRQVQSGEALTLVERALQRVQPLA